jgi:hypothetical protein
MQKKLPQSKKLIKDGKCSSYFVYTGWDPIFVWMSLTRSSMKPKCNFKSRLPNLAGSTA